MEQIIKSCDRCKQVTDGLITIVMTNATIEESKGFEEKEASPGIVSMFYLGPQVVHPTIRWEMCESCTKELIRWSGHTENQLMGVEPVKVGPR